MYSVAAVGIGAIGMALVTLSGNLFMLSMGATAAVSTVMFAALIHLGLGATLFLVVLSGLLMGAVQGGIIALGKANPIITTIATSSIIIGAGVIYTGGLTVIGKGDATWLGQVKLFGWLPTQILVLASSLQSRASFSRSRVSGGKSGCSECELKLRVSPDFERWLQRSFVTRSPAQRLHWPGP